VSFKYHLCVCLPVLALFPDVAAEAACANSEDVPHALRSPILQGSGWVRFYKLEGLEKKKKTQNYS
jgi:hypothetical protein